MKMRLCYKITIPGENGESKSYGLSLEQDGVKEGVTYQQLAAVIDKQKLIDAVCLTGTVTPDQMELIDPDEFDKEFGDDLEDITERVNA